MTTPLQAALFVLVALGAGLVVVTRRIDRQMLVFSFYGLLMTLLFVSLQAPDVALSELAVGQRHATNVVTAVNYDYRGLDTMGEEYILFASITGLALLMRHLRGEAKDGIRPPDAVSGSDAVRALGLMGIGVMAVYGIYVVVHGQLTPGGGFQGGVLLGTSLLITYLGTDYATFRRVSPQIMLHLADSLGAGGYAVVGTANLVAGGAFLQNLLPLGKTGSLLSAGTIPVVNLCVGLEVTAGFAMMFAEFLRQSEGEEK